MTDIGAYGSGAGRAYWIKQTSMHGEKHLQLVRFDEQGETHELELRAEWDDAGWTLAEAAIDFHADAIAEADRTLERRRETLKDLPEPEPPMDPATAKFFGDGPGVEI